MVTTEPRPTRSITVAGRLVTIGGWDTPNAGLMLVHATRTPVPLDIAKLAAGPDAWMRQIPVECRECCCEFKLCDSDSHEYCQKCFDEAGEENARLDAGE